MTSPPPEAQPAYYAPWLAAWTGLAALAVMNGLTRGLYARRLGEARAHQVSSAALVAVVLPYVGMVERRWPLPTARAAATVGAAWVGMTVVFEFGFGHYVAQQRWSVLLDDYDLRRGRLWPLVLGVTGTAPALARAIHKAQHRRTMSADGSSSNRAGDLGDHRPVRSKM